MSKSFSEESKEILLFVFIRRSDVHDKLLDYGLFKSYKFWFVNGVFLDPKYSTDYYLERALD